MMNINNSTDLTGSTSGNEEDISLNCIPCNLNFDKLQTYNLHLHSVSHLKKTLKLENHTSDDKLCKDRSICHVCGSSFFDEKSYKIHLKDAEHQKKLEMMKEAHIRNEMLIEDAFQDNEAYQQRIAKQLKVKLPNEECEEFNPDSNELYCQICQVCCYGTIPFKMHLDGAKHKKKLERHGYGALTSDDLEKSIDELIDECREPLIGLEYLVQCKDNEVNKYDYLCELCDTKLIIDQVIHHLTGLSHRHKYYKLHDSSIYEYLWNLVPRSLKSAKAREFAKNTEAKLGRKNISYLRESSKYVFEYKVEKEVTKLSSYHADDTIFNSERVCKRLDTKLIEKAIIKYNFELESDIEAAILMTNILIEAVLKNKLKMLEKNGKTDEGIENMFKYSKKTKLLLDTSNISDPLLSQAVEEAYKLERGVIYGNMTFCKLASSFLHSLEKKFMASMEKRRDRLDDEESGCNVDIWPKKFKFGL